MISFIMTIGLFYGSLLNQSLIPLPIFYFVFTLFFGSLSREIIKGCEDIEGDKKFGINTLAIKIGIKKATYFAFSFGILAIIFFVLPVFAGLFNIFLYSIFMIFGIILIIYALALMLNSALEKKSFSKISLLLKLTGFFGIIAFLLSSFEF